MGHIYVGNNHIDHNYEIGRVRPDDQGCQWHTEWLRHNHTGHTHIGHDYTGHDYTGHDCIGHNHAGHNYVGHLYRP